MTGTCIFGDSATFIYKDCRVLFGDILLYLSWVQPWDIWQQCAARSGEIWLQLPGMICPWAGNLTANFWKLPNPQPIPVSPRRLNIKAANTARIDLSSTWYLILQSLTNPERVTVKKETSNIDGKTHCQFFYSSLTLWRERKPAKIPCERNMVKWATKLPIKRKAKKKRVREKISKWLITSS